jgi:hypothetical protein
VDNKGGDKMSHLQSVTVGDFVQFSTGAGFIIGRVNKIENGIYFVACNFSNNRVVVLEVQPNEIISEAYEYTNTEGKRLVLTPKQAEKYPNLTIISKADDAAEMKKLQALGHNMSRKPIKVEHIPMKTVISIAADSKAQAQKECASLSCHDNNKGVCLVNRVTTCGRYITTHDGDLSEETYE